MDKHKIQKIKTLLRREFIKDPERNECLRKARIKRGTYKCFECERLFKRKEVQIHHTKEVGEFNGDWNEYIYRLFCEADLLVCLCEMCHKKSHQKNT